MLSWIFGINFLVCIDQIFKVWMYRVFNHQPSWYDMTSFFRIFLTKNTGISLSIFSLGAGSKRWILIFITMLIVAVLFCHLRRNTRKMVRLGLCFIIGGALSNVVDRIFWGGVIDFFNLHYKNYNFPIFNSSDMLITLGVTVLLLGDVFVVKNHSTLGK